MSDDDANSPENAMDLELRAILLTFPLFLFQRINHAIHETDARTVFATMYNTIKPELGPKNPLKENGTKTTLRNLPTLNEILGETFDWSKNGIEAMWENDEEYNIDLGDIIEPEPKPSGPAFPGNTRTEDPEDPPPGGHNDVTDSTAEDETPTITTIARATSEGIQISTESIKSASAVGLYTSWIKLVRASLNKETSKAAESIEEEISKTGIDDVKKTTKNQLDKKLSQIRESAWLWKHELDNHHAIEKHLTAIEEILSEWDYGKTNTETNLCYHLSIIAVVASMIESEPTSETRLLIESAVDIINQLHPDVLVRVHMLQNNEKATEELTAAFEEKVKPLKDNVDVRVFDSAWFYIENADTAVGKKVSRLNDSMEAVLLTKKSQKQAIRRTRGERRNDNQTVKTTLPPSEEEDGEEEDITTDGRKRNRDETSVHGQDREEDENLEEIQETLPKKRKIDDDVNQQEDEAAEDEKKEEDSKTQPRSDPTTHQEE